MSKHIKILLVLLILGGALGLRLVALDKSPLAINWDEASLGYNAYSLALTGKDEHGKSWPLSLKSFGDYKPSLYSILSVPVVKIFGLNQRSVKYISVIAGVMSLVALWLCLRIWIKSEWQQILIMTMISFEPWRLHFSRTALETNLSAMLFGFGTFFLLFSKKYKTNLMIVFSFVFFALSAYSYHSARVAVPVLLFLFYADPLSWFQKRKQSFNLKWLGAIFVWLLLMLPILMESNSQGAVARFNQENIVSKLFPFVSREIYNGDLESTLRVNPGYYFAGTIVGHLASYISPVNYSTNIFPWIKDSVQYTPEFNFYGLIEIFFLVIGMGVLMTNVSKFEYRFLIYWLVAAVAPAVVTWNWFHGLRIANGMMALEIIMALGLGYFIKSMPSKFAWMAGVTFGVLLLWQLVFVINNELVFANTENYSAYQPGGFKEGALIIKDIMDSYDQIIVESPYEQSYIFFLFYLNYPPQKFQTLTRTNNDFDKFVFRDINFAEDGQKHKTILWIPREISFSDVAKIPGAKAYYVDGPLKTFKAATIITLE